MSLQEDQAYMGQVERAANSLGWGGWPCAFANYGRITLMCLDRAQLVAVAEKVLELEGFVIRKQAIGRRALAAELKYLQKG